jgi:two-component system sensor histidine kinase/response regulator
MDLHAAVDQIRQFAHSSLETKKIRFSNDVPPGTSVFADPNMILTILRNLTSNAIKFSPENGNISISSQEGEGKVKVKVKDDGVGISEKDQERLFTFGEFHSTSGTGGEQGTGLGLLICQEFVKKNGGNLAVESEKGKGSIFYFDLPIAERNAGSDQQGRQA